MERSSSTNKSKTTKTKKQAKAKVLKKKKSNNGPTCSTFLSELKRKFTSKKKSEPEASKNVIQTIVETLNKALPIKYSKKVIKKEIQSELKDVNNSPEIPDIEPMEIEITPIQEIKLAHLVPNVKIIEFDADHLNKLDNTIPTKAIANIENINSKHLEPSVKIIDVAMNSNKLDNKTPIIPIVNIENIKEEPLESNIESSTVKTQINEYTMPRMPIVDSEELKLAAINTRKLITKGDMSTNTGTGRDIANEILKHVNTLRKISLIAEEFNQKNAKSLKEIVASVQKDLIKKLDEIELDQKATKIQEQVQEATTSTV